MIILNTINFLELTYGPRLALVKTVLEKSPPSG